MHKKVIVTNVQQKFQKCKSSNTMQLPDPGEGALGVDGAGVWKKCATIKLKTMFIAAMVVLYDVTLVIQFKKKNYTNKLHNWEY